MIINKTRRCNLRFLVCQCYDNRIKSVIIIINIDNLVKKNAARIFYNSLN